MIKKFEDYLRTEEKSEKTVEKYIRDVRYFERVCGRTVNCDVPYTKQDVIYYKKHLAQSYNPNSANSMLASLNAYLRFIGHAELCVKQFKVQRNTYCPEERELSKAEYARLSKAARDTRLNLIIQTICGTGIRVSELKYVTVDGVKRGEFTVSCKSKTRTVFIIRELQKKLLKYIKDKCIESGSVFVTKNGRPIDRTAVWRNMKRLCRAARVKESKARCFHTISATFLQGPFTGWKRI